MIAVNQDAKMKAGIRVSSKGDLEVWARELQNGVAVALINKTENKFETLNSTMDLLN